MSKASETAGGVGSVIAGIIGLAWGVVALWATWVLAVGGNLPFTHHHVDPNPFLAAAWFFIGIPLSETVLWWAVMLVVGLIVAPFAAGAAVAGKVGGHNRAAPALPTQAIPPSTEPTSNVFVVGADD